MHLEEGKSIGQIAALFGWGRTVVHHRAIKDAYYLVTEIMTLWRCRDRRVPAYLAPSVW
jgi:hypothetical protein